MNTDYLKKALHNRCLANYYEMSLDLKFFLLSDSNGQDYRKAFYLYLEALRFLNKHAETRLLLDNIPFEDHSIEYLKAIRKAVDSKESLPWFEAKSFKYISEVNNNLDVLFNYAVLLRDLGYIEKANEYLKKRLHLIIENKKTIDKNKKTIDKNKISWSSLAEKALIDLNSALGKNNIEFFLISGTLLGVVRDAKLLEHDYDIDIGIDQRFSKDIIIKSIAESTSFYLLENSNSDYLICFNHINGVKIDIFIHYLEDNLYKHQSSNAIWINSPFSLKKINFLENDFLIPKNENKYLIENYGDWKNPVYNYNSFIDTPNIIIENKEKLIFQYLLSLTNSIINEDRNMFFKVLNHYIKETENNDHSFIYPE